MVEQDSKGLLIMAGSDRDQEMVQMDRPRRRTSSPAGRLVGLHPGSRVHGTRRGEAARQDARAEKSGPPASGARLPAHYWRSAGIRMCWLSRFAGRPSYPSPRAGKRCRGAPSLDRFRSLLARNGLNMKGLDSISAVFARLDAYPSTMAGCRFAAHCGGICRSGARPAARGSGARHIARAPVRSPGTQETRQA